jgi:hypothetical protein
MIEVKQALPAVRGHLVDSAVRLDSLALVRVDLVNGIAGEMRLASRGWRTFGNCGLGEGDVAAARKNRTHRPDTLFEACAKPPCRCICDPGQNK